MALKVPHIASSLVDPPGVPRIRASQRELSRSFDISSAEAEEGRPRKSLRSANKS